MIYVGYTAGLALKAFIQPVPKITHTASIVANIRLVRLYRI